MLLQKKEDEVKRKKRKLKELKEAFADEDDIREAEEEYQEAADELPELISARDQAVNSGSRHIMDALNVIIQTIDNVLHEKILATELALLRGRVARYQRLFQDEVMPFVMCADFMQQAALSTDSKVYALPAPGQWSSATKAIVGEFAVCGDSPKIEALEDDINPYGN